MSAVQLSVSRLLAIGALTLAGAVLFPLAGVLPWAWARECGGFGVILGLAFFAPAVTGIAALDWGILSRRLTLARALLVILLTVASEWILGIVFFSTQWGC